VALPAAFRTVAVNVADSNAMPLGMMVLASQVTAELLETVGETLVPFSVSSMLATPLVWSETSQLTDERGRSVVGRVMHRTRANTARTGRG
jgi:hypothetical protein